MSSGKAVKRHQARVVAMQALFQWQSNPVALSDLLEQYLVERDLNNHSKFDGEFFRELLAGCLEHMQHIDDVLRPLCDRPLEKLTAVELSVLRLAAYEMEFILKTPYKVVINEAIILCKDYGAKGGHGFINAVLDKLAKALRPDEIA